MGLRSAKDLPSDQGKKVLGKAVRLFRLAQNLDQNQVAARFNARARTRKRLTQSTVSNIETGRSQTALNLAMVAEALGVDADEFGGLANYLLGHADEWAMEALGTVLDAADIAAGNVNVPRSEAFLSFLREKAALGMAYTSGSKQRKPAPAPRRLGAQPSGASPT